MHMSPDAFSDLFARLCVSGPLLYIGLLMVRDPASFSGMLDNLGRGVHGGLERFRDNWQSRFIRGMQRPWPPAEPPSRRTLLWIRTGGALLSAFALLSLIGIDRLTG